MVGMHTPMQRLVGHVFTPKSILPWPHVASKFSPLHLEGSAKYPVLYISSASGLHFEATSQGERSLGDALRKARRVANIFGRVMAQE